MKKVKWWQKVLLTIAGMVINNQKGIKGTDNVNKINDVIDELKK